MTDKPMKVAEIFGPTIQGEGPQVGVPAYFIRFGGCDYRCVWCDSLHAVLPEHVKKLPSYSSLEILEKLEDLDEGGSVVVLSGGNPLVWELGDLVWRLHSREMLIAVETQGTIWKDWLLDLQSDDFVIVSPKPPSSEMITDWNLLTEFWMNLEKGFCQRALKIVVFNIDDLFYAYEAAERLHVDELFISIGTVAEEPLEDTLTRYRNVIKMHFDMPDRHKSGSRIFRILPQVHVVIWGHKLGV